MRNIFEFEDYFSDKELIKILCRKRSLAAKRLHDSHFLRNISKDSKNPRLATSKKIYKYFPPRSSWIRLDKVERLKRNTNAIEVNAIQLERTIWRMKKKNSEFKDSDPDWLKNLNELIKDIQLSALNKDSNYIIPKPSTIPILKDKSKQEYRPISSFDLKDLIIIGQVSKYLTNCFDPLFLDCSYAFRSGQLSRITKNHHEAVRKIIEYNSKRKSEIYVAECDIKKFYDCVNHSVIRKRFAEFIVKAYGNLGIGIDQRAIRLFFSYLNCFSFNNDVDKRQVELLNKIGIKDGNIPWVAREELIEVGSNPDTDMIGIPQGGALSCLIANLMLDPIDRTIILLNHDDIFYARFCDDMILMHPSKEVCANAFKEYQNALKDVKLISHIPVYLEKYSSEFWGDKMKSKATYKWDQFDDIDPERESNVPWVSFVGYQIRYDNLLRIRKKSIEKELRKQVAEVDKIIKVVKRNRRASINKKAVAFRLQQRLISMAVGRIQPNTTILKMCWAAGFNVIKENNCILAQFARLDKNRERQIIRMRNFMKSITTPISKSTKRIKQLNFYGSRFSYYNQFANKES